MSIEFEENVPEYRPLEAETKSGPIIRIVKKLGLAKTDGQASFILILVFLIALGLAAYITFTSQTRPENSTSNEPQFLLDGQPVSQSELETIIKNSQQL